MDESEKKERLILRGVRFIATTMQRLERNSEIVYTRLPELQAEEILTDRFGDYKLAYTLIANSTSIDWGLIRTLKGKFDPLEVIRQITMPIVKFHLELQERRMIELGYRLPKWKRPQWLQEVGRGKVKFYINGNEV